MTPLPRWRLIAAWLIFGGMAAVLLALAPVYMKNFELQRYIRDLAQRPDAATTADQSLTASIVDRAHRLNLPVGPGDVKISRAGGKVQVQAKYAVLVDFRLYQVDLHFR